MLRPGLSSDKVKRFKNEINFCFNPPSERIIRVVDYGKADNGSPFYVMPLYPSTLQQRIESHIPSDEVLELFSHILDGLEATHFLGVYHRDLKPENILSDTTSGLVVADFGIAHFQEDDLLTTVETGPRAKMANFCYASPEQRIQGSPVDHRADIYALGLILNEMYTQRVAHGTGFVRIRDVAPSYAYLDDMVEKMMQQDPNRRPQSIREIKEELIARGHEFVILQRLNEAKRQVVVPESDVDDPIINDPIRVVDTIDYVDGILLLKLNQAVNTQFNNCFQNSVSHFTVNPSSATLSLRGNIAEIRVSERFIQEGVNFLKEHLAAANGAYAARVRQEHLHRIENSRAALKAELAQAEERARMLQGIRI
jgi:serine/threonine protein kinase